MRESSLVGVRGKGGREGDRAVTGRGGTNRLVEVSGLPGASETDTPIPRDGHARGFPVACRIAGTSEKAREAVSPRPKSFLAHADGHRNIPGGLPGDERGKAMVCDCRPPW